MYFCIYCGQQISNDAKFCQNCGKLVWNDDKKDGEYDSSNAVEEYANGNSGVGVHSVTSIEVEKPKAFWPRHRLGIILLTVVAVMVVGYGIMNHTSKGMQASTQRVTSEEWLNSNQDVLDSIMQNEIRLGKVNTFYRYLLEAKDIRALDKIVDNAQRTKQKLGKELENGDAANLRQLIDKQLSGQIDTAQYAKKCILSNKSQSDYQNGLNKQTLQVGNITDPQSPLGALLKKYKIDVEGLYKKAYNAIDNERY